MIAILGGTFNPIHLGHLHLAKQLQSKFGFDTVRFMPAALPALKDTPNASAEQRAEMVKISIQNQNQFTLDTQELSRPGVSYTIDTLISLRKELGNEVSLCWLMGSDAFVHLNAWHRWQELLNYAHLVVVKRPHSDALTELNEELKKLLSTHEAKRIEEIRQQAHGKILIQEIAALDISSTKVRENIAHGKEIGALVPKAAMRYIEENHLYKQK
jgi:nicotinate-nucleotide adenylyltransferase